jgi:hypothetical protein
MLDTVIKAYTEGKTELSITGRIPIKEFDSMEADLRPEMRARGLRVWYRGPRMGSSALGEFDIRNPQGGVTATHRKHATHAVIYTK